MWFRMLVLEKRRRKKNPSSRNDRLIRLLKVTRRDKKRNETVWVMLHQETLIDRIGERRLNWFRHVSWMGSEMLPANVMNYHVSGIAKSRKTTKKMHWQHKRWNGNKEHTPTRSNDYCVGQKQMEVTNSSLIIIVKWWKKKTMIRIRQCQKKHSPTHTCHDHQ